MNGRQTKTQPSRVRASNSGLARVTHLRKGVGQGLRRWICEWMVFDGSGTAVVLVIDVIGVDDLAK